MVDRRSVYAGVWVCALLIFLPGVAFGQSGIAGTVRDATGAVLPGVTVEASSPALIEKSRTVFTDGQGRYQIVELRPGIYEVTFTLTGFSTVRREGIELPSSFTATVNAEMRVGAIEETIIVSGQASTVDVQNTLQRQVLSDNFIEALPVLRAGPQMYVTTVPATTGVKLGANGRVSKNYSIHNSRSRDAVMAIDGFAMASIRASGGSSDVFYQNQATIEEMSVELGTASAERELGGTFANIIPKEGSNSFSGAFFGSFTNEALQADNLTDELKLRGLTSTNKHKKYWDLNPAFGGPIIRDTLWFYSSGRYSGNIDTVAGMYYDTNPKDWVYTPDLNRPAINDVIDHDINTRLTWQAAPKHKITAFYDYQPRVLRHANIDTLGSVAVTPEATTIRPYYPNANGQIVWKSPMTSRLLLEGGINVNMTDYNPRYQPEQDADDTVAAFDQALSLEFRAPAPTGNNAVGHHNQHTYASRAAASFITGSHAFKFGANVRWGREKEDEEANGSMRLTLAQGVARSVTLVATPIEWQNNVNADLGVFAQDQWTFKRATVGLGLRYDYFNLSTAAQELAAGRFVPARSYPATDALNYHDLSPRLGVAYDLFGDSKTALKATLNRYVVGLGAENGKAQHPVLTVVRTATRTWTDTNGNYEPDCDLLRPERNQECGPLSNVDFGKANPRVTITDPDILRGFAKRSYNWETSVVLEREIVSRVSVSAGYFRRWYGNFTTTENLEVTPADYDHYCITAPVDPRLPGGGGNQICGLYTVTPQKFGQVQSYQTFTNKFQGTRREIYNGVDLTMNARLAKGGQISGGLSTGRTAVSNCLVVDSPEEARFCDRLPPFLTNVRFTAIYPLPWWSLQVATVVQSIPGEEITATYVATNAEIRTSLNRDLASGPNGTVNVPLIAPGTVYDKRAFQLDVRVGKVFPVGRVRVRADLDLFNLLNGNGVTQHTTGYGPNWLKPRDVQPARFVQFSTAVTF